MLLDLHSDMALLRAFDEQAVDYQRQGRIGTYAPHWGHEALQVGAIRALADGDWVFPSYRESAIGLLRGMPVETVLSWWRGEPAGSWDPREHGVANVCVPIATHVPHAVGFAWGERLKGESTCALAFFGDGATSEGAFHEGLTFAGVMRAPVVLLCNNNGWALSTPLSAQTAAERLSDKAAGYGIPALRVDGGDVLAVHEAVAVALDRARGGGGPTFVEAITQRMAPHATADRPDLYWDEELVATERERECLVRFERDLAERGVLSAEAARAVRERSRDEVRAAMAVVEARPPAAATAIFDTAYANPPASVLRSRDAARDKAAAGRDGAP
jgi:pyruvate dehydrogenase E1 component alpha subunit